MRFTAELELNGRTATGIEVPPSVMDGLGGGRRPLITVTLNGHGYRSAIGIMDGRSMIPVSAEHRAAAGIAAGDRVEVTIELDTEKREVEVPPDLQRELAARPRADAAFGKLSNSGKKRHVLSIEGAKTEETRRRRIAKAIEQLEAPG